MKLQASAKIHAFYLSNMMVAVAVASIVLAATLTSSVGLQKSFNQIENYSATHSQQIRIVDYLARDVRRGLSVTSSVDRQTVTITVPKYIYQAGDPDLPDSSKIATPRPPRRDYVPGLANQDARVNYGSTAVGVSTVVYSVNQSRILRTQDGVVTTIASSTDNIVPETTDVELSNTEYTTTAVTFQPISPADRNGTVVYSTAYLRNRRRPPP